ncbi:hypothetical protein LTR64_006794 [Lithohypha guttulata]|uniref:uncharacterized protein n=1 Tax=Lithohypha guttulata TaxID=1690604 RepID=UPI002DDDFD21|nr:hypothetical protein LTR51_004648 [Lithohypha guttulata]
MHYFDPTLDWPKELLEDQMPDLIIIQSKNLKDLGAPWQVSDSGWTTCWVQYAASGSEARFLNWIFLDGVFASEDDRKQVAAYLGGLADQEVSIHRYRGLSVTSNLPILLTAPIVKCRPAAPETAASRNWSLRYNLMSSSGSSLSDLEAWSTLLVESNEHDQAIPRPAHENQLGVYSTLPFDDSRVTDSVDGVEVEGTTVTLYVVASSSNLQQHMIWSNSSVLIPDSGASTMW